MVLSSSTPYPATCDKISHFSTFHGTRLVGAFTVPGPTLSATAADLVAVSAGAGALYLEVYRRGRQDDCVFAVTVEGMVLAEHAVPGDYCKRESRATLSGDTLLVTNGTMLYVCPQVGPLETICLEDPSCTHGPRNSTVRSWLGLASVLFRANSSLGSKASLCLVDLDQHRVVHTQLQEPAVGTEYCVLSQGSHSLALVQGYDSERCPDKPSEITVLSTVLKSAAGSQPLLFALQADDPVWDASGRYLAVSLREPCGISIHHGVSGALLSSLETQSVIFLTSLQWLPDARLVCKTDYAPLSYSAQGWMIFSFASASCEDLRQIDRVDDNLAG